MNDKYNPQGKPQQQSGIDACSSNLPEPSLWNSAVGRRMFIKATGAATVATVIALHGFKIEVLASGSAYQMEK
jgi:hypothetical protein